MRLPRPAAASVLVAAAACSPSANTLQVTVEAYISAVSLGDAGRVLDMSAPYQRERLQAPGEEARRALEASYRDRIERGYVLWEQAKATGELAPDPLGVALIRAIGLGKEGAAALPLKVEFDRDKTRAMVTTRAITNYDSIRWGSVPAGGRMYLMGHPFGKVVNFATGYDDPSVLSLLATVDLEWTLATIPGLERPAGAASDWYVEGVRPLDGTATSWSPPAPG
ncbi:MAG TPA: hypothetical protein VJV23_08485 [Candidatus Polarisedimenticolia bacterium]|nr:hypothetical protein [Candidatus Polarisedimenticolia bacterium]